MVSVTRESAPAVVQPVVTHDKLTSRVALKEKSTNCTPWADVSSYGVSNSLRGRKKAVAEIKVVEEGRDKCGIDRIGGSDRELLHQGVEEGRDNFGINRIGGSDKELLHQGSHTKAAEFECTMSPLRCLGKRYSTHSDTFAMHPASVQRVHSLIQALAEMNMESSLLSEHEESETEVEGELDLIHFAFDAPLSPKKDLQAQQARNLLLKEAAMDAFGRPSFQSNIHPVGLQEAKQPSPGLAALMSMRLPSSEADTSKIREVLKLLSVAELEMGTEQKTLFYNQLRIVLDGLKTPTSATKLTQGVSRNMTASSGTSGANSWPRRMKEPTHTVTSVDSTSIKEAIDNTVNQESSLKMIKPIESHEIGTDQEQLPSERSVASCETAQALELSKGLDSDKPGLKLCLANEENDNVTEQADKSPHSHLCSRHVVQVEQALIKGHCGVESAEEPAAQVQNGHDSNYFTDSDHHEIAQAKSDEVSACILSDHMESGDYTKVHSASTEVKNISACCEVEGKDVFGYGACVGGEDMSMQASKGAGCGRSDDVGSDGSFEFRLTSTVSTPLSTPSTPMLSTTSTPRHLHHTNAPAPLTAQEIAEIWQAFD